MKGRDPWTNNNIIPTSTTSYPRITVRWALHVNCMHIYNIYRPIIFKKKKSFFLFIFFKSKTVKSKKWFFFFFKYICTHIFIFLNCSKIGLIDRSIRELSNTLKIFANAGQEHKLQCIYYSIESGRATRPADLTVIFFFF